MKIVITGNMGYVGPNVVRQLRQSFPDAELIGVDAGFFAHCLTNTDALPEAQLDAQIFADVRQFPEEVLEGADGVIHLAAISNDILGSIDETATLDINFRSSIRIAEMAKRQGVKAFVFASSCSVYGFAEDGARTEKSPVNPLTAYARSKVATEEGLAPLAGEDFSVTCLRFATACGMSQRLRLDLVLNDFVAGALAAKKITVLSDGSPWRPLIHVRDMALAMEWALGRTAEQGGPFLLVNAGTEDWNYQVRDLAQAVAEIIPGTGVSINTSAAPDKRSYKVNFARYRELAPMHQPRISLRDAIMDLRDGLIGMNFNDPDFRNSNLIRLNVLKALKAKGHLSQDCRWNHQKEEVKPWKQEKSADFAKIL